MDRTLAKLWRRLERWELQHLRDHARELADRVEELEEQLSDMRRQVADADDRAGFWHESFLQLAEQLGGDQRLGMTRSGALIVIEDRDVVDVDQHCRE